MKNLFITFVVISIVTLIVAYGKAGSVKGLEVKVITLEQGVIASSISATGRVVSGQEVEVVSSVNSRVMQVVAKEGQLASKGSLLVELDGREAFAKIKSDKAILSEAHVKLEQAQKSLKALRNVYKVGGTSFSSVQDAELQCVVAQAAEIKAAAELGNSALYLERFRIVAPFSGVIVKKSVQSGDLAVPGVSLLTLADMSKTEVEVSVDESDAGALRVGQLVEVSCEAFPNRSWKEKIVRIEYAVRKDGSANSLKAHVSFSNNSELRLGQQVDVKIKLAEKRGVYKVPFDAVVHRDGKSYLATIRDSKVHFESVLTGVEDASSVEVLSPVRPNEDIILSDGKSMHEGQVVSLVTRIK